MSLNAILRAFQSQHRAIADVKTAPDPDALPRSLNDDDLPCVISIPGPGSWSYPGLNQQDRTVIIRCYVKPVLQGENYGPAVQVATRLIQAIGEKHRGDPTIGGALEQIVPEYGEFTDGGLEALEYAGALFHAVEFQVEVREKP